MQNETRHVAPALPAGGPSAADDAAAAADDDDAPQTRPPHPTTSLARGPPTKLNSSPSSGRVFRFDSFVPSSSSSPSPPTVGGEGEEVEVVEEEEEGQQEGAHQCRADPLVAQASPDFQALPWAYRQHLLYRHCRHFPLRIDQPGACAGTHGAPYLLLAIKSRVQDFGHRELVRQTWGAGGDHRVRRVFLLGTLPDSGNVTFWDEFLKHESRAYGDLLQWGFHDTFLNLTLKGLVIAGLADLLRPADKLSAAQSGVLTATGTVWSRYSLVITPVNYNLFAVNLFLAFAGGTQLFRIWRFDQEQKAKAKQED
ncbi:uncharacterized protein LOC144949980 [Lampetra fluviatilis]